MMFPELVHRDTGIRYAFNTLTREQLAYYVKHAGQWAPGMNTKPGSSLEVRKIIAAKLLAGEI